MEVVKIEGSDSVVECSRVEWETRMVGPDGRRFAKEYLIIRLSDRDRPITFPYSQNGNGAWKAMTDTFEKCTGTKLNGNVKDIFPGKKLKTARFNITYGGDYKEDRELVVGIVDPSVVLADDKAAEEQKMKEYAEDSVASVIGLTEARPVRVDALIKSVLESAVKNKIGLTEGDVEDAIGRLMGKGEIYEPRPGRYDLVVRASSRPAVPKEEPKGIPEKVSYNFVTEALARLLFNSHLNPNGVWYGNETRNMTADDTERFQFHLGVVQSSGMIIHDSGQKVVKLAPGWGIESKDGKKFFVRVPETGGADEKTVPAVSTEGRRQEESSSGPWNL